MIKVLVDNSVIEVWFNDTFSLTGRAYPTREDANCVLAYVERQPAAIISLSAWEMDAIWPKPEE